MDAQDILSTITGGVIQQGRLLKLDTPLGSNVLLPQRLIGRSRMGRHYEFALDAVSASGTIELKSLIAQPVTLWIQQTDQSYLPHHGYVHTARRLGSDGNLTSYQIGFASWMHFLRFRKDARIWIDKTAENILFDVFTQHPQARGAFQFQLNRTPPSRSFCIQYEDDWNFVHRIMESEGMFGYFEQGSDGRSHTLVITDTILSLKPFDDKLVQFYRAGTGSETDALTQWSGERRLQSTTLTTRTYDYKGPWNRKQTGWARSGNQGVLPEQAEIYEYTGAYSYQTRDSGEKLMRMRVEEWDSQAKRFFGAGGVRRLDTGKWFGLENHPDHANDSQQNREFAVIETAWFIENNLPASSHTVSFPDGLKDELDAVRKAHEDAAPKTTGDMLAVTHTDGSEGFFLVEVEAQRRTVPYRSPFEHRKPEMHIQTATVVGPRNEEIYTDELNRIKVRFHWDRLSIGTLNSSGWVRVAFSDTGGSYGGVHVPRIGEEVLIDWLEGDCDRPIATGRVYNGSTTPQWHSHGLLSGYKSKECQGNGYNQLVMDDSTGQNRTQLFSSSANSQLHLGYLVSQTDNARGSYLGSGFDLKSDAYGAVRAAQGLFVSTHPASSAQPLEVGNASSQLVNSESVLEAMSQASQTHQAESLGDGHDALKAFTDAMQNSVPGSSSGGKTAGGGTGSANAFKQPVMLFASPSGIAMSTQQSVHVSSDRQTNLVRETLIYSARQSSLTGPRTL